MHEPTPPLTRRREGAMNELASRRLAAKATGEGIDGEEEVPLFGGDHGEHLLPRDLHVVLVSRVLLDVCYQIVGRVSARNVPALAANALCHGPILSERCS